MVGVSLALPRCYGVRLKSKLSAWASKGVVYASWRMSRAPYNRYCVKSRAAGGTSEERMGNQEECPPNLGLMREGNGEEGGKQRRERGEGEGGGNSWAQGGRGILDDRDPTRLCLSMRPTPCISADGPVRLSCDKSSLSPRLVHGLVRPTSLVPAGP